MPCLPEPEQATQRHNATQLNSPRLAIPNRTFDLKNPCLTLLHHALADTNMPDTTKANLGLHQQAKHYQVMPIHGTTFQG